MAGILAAAAAMTGCAEQNKTATQVDYTQNAQGKSEQTKQKTAEKSQPDKKQVNKSTSGGKENSNQTADKKTKVFASSNNAGDVQNSENDADNTDDSQNTYVDNNSSENNGSTGDGGNQIDQTADQAMIYDSEGNGRLISQADDGNWYDSDGNYYGSWEDIEDAMQRELEYPDSPIMQALFEGMVFAIIIAMIIAIIYMIRTYVKTFNKTKKLGSDYIEYISPDDENVRADKDVSKVKTKEPREVRSVRKLYKKHILKGTGGKAPDETVLPSVLTTENITADSELSEKITAVYEKARYSREQITKEEKNIFNNL